MAQGIDPSTPKRWPLVTELENRDDSTDKDAKLVNCFLERQRDGSYWLFKRPGMRLTAAFGDGGNGYGIFNWRGNVYSIFGTKIYKDGVELGTVDATGGVYRFSQVLGATPQLVLGNGVTAYRTDGTTLTEITDGDFPATFLKGWAYLNGTLYVGRSDAGIQGSAVNDPSSWDPLNVIIAQIEPDQGVALFKQLVYVGMMKQWSIEFFYDAANATGSPLGRVEGAKISIGCAHQDTPRDIDGMQMLASTTRFSGWQFALIDNMKAKLVSTNPVERLLLNPDTSEGVFSWASRIGGHRFYCVTVKAENLSLVYDVEQDRWGQWTDPDGNYFPFVDATYDSSGNRLLQHETNGRIYRMDQDFWRDGQELITVDIYTPNWDGGARVIKQLDRMRFIADQVKGSTLQVRYNDNDYQASQWTNYQNVDLGLRTPELSNQGSFYRRAYNFRHRQDLPFRIQAVDLGLSLGTN